MAKDQNAKGGLVCAHPALVLRGGPRKFCSSWKSLLLSLALWFSTPSSPFLAPLAAPPVLSVLAQFLDPRGEPQAPKARRGEPLAPLALVLGARRLASPLFLWVPPAAARVHPAPQAVRVLP